MGITTLLVGAGFVIHLAVAARAITRPNRTPASRVAWVAVIMALPAIGVIGYLFLGETSIGHDRVRRLRQALDSMPPPSQAEPAAVAAVPAWAASSFGVAGSINGFHPVTGNRMTVLGDPDLPATEPMTDSNIAIDTLIADIGRAQHTVHLGFYIWLDDHNGGRVTDAVCEAARRGVTCRVMVDALGSRAFVKSPRWTQLRDAGVKTVATLNDIPRLGIFPIGRPDLRNHRKIAVIDNTIGYCGSQNCADPEFRVEAKYAPWIDILLRLEGPVVRQEQYIFLATWIAESGEDVGALVTEEPAPTRHVSGGTALMSGTGPTDPGNPMSDLFVTTIYAAQRDLTITTPYFVPDEALLRAVCAAPLRGVRTRIVFPARNNSTLVGATCRSTYGALLAAGVEVYEYPLGLLHTKSITADGELALVGSANMDRRSLQLNFENNLLLADPAVTAAVLRRQESYLSVSKRVPSDEAARWPWHRRLIDNAIGMLSPLL
ncbi:cardiolipin synthase [Nocardioides sp. GXZ039]|uniref:cardiolipin synthase n=1 Tax=Nocardioides sp. GXZ039 TaxID=3136018 RepID=UPI0030F483AF